MSLVEPSDSEDTEKEPEVQTTVGSFNSTESRTKPKFTKPDQMHKICVKPAGNMIKLKCPAEGNPFPNITWTKDGLPPTRHLGTIRYSRWSIVLEDLVTDDAGNYTCIVCNTEGCIDFTFNVDVMGKYNSSFHSPPMRRGSSPLCEDTWVRKLIGIVLSRAIPTQALYKRRISEKSNGARTLKRHIWMRSLFRYRAICSMAANLLYPVYFGRDTQWDRHSGTLIGHSGGGWFKVYCLPWLWLPTVIVVSLVSVLVLQTTLILSINSGILVLFSGVGICCKIILQMCSSGNWVFQNGSLEQLKLV